MNDPHQRQPASKPQANQRQQALSQFQSFPQPQQPAQQDLHQRLQRNPYQRNLVNQPQSFIPDIQDAVMPPASAVPKQLNFITGNKNKLAEVQAILDGVIELRNKNIDLVEIQGTVEEVVTDKCRRAAEAVNGPVLVEDTCLCFRAMNDLPGPYIKWFMLSLGPLQLHKMLDGFEDKTTQAVCTFAYSEGPDHEPVLFQGKTEGKLVASRGSTVFGWDSCFEYEGKTYAEMEKSEKNKISHRGKALEKLQEWLASRVDG
ncbi:hypothetical protein K505DRAFT_324137 [Melanomma pulvis-pyrius CBS 109.77]|uniref:Inosine triphosphate pyrophosphatase n=1 Tax=Melanomma pulvis-pyrius CBS 109.77 TaxID=1314802 RepID=A0A6A6XGW3_9PLEO|nr:hypothetical protein K505DRAFT_324137 [Melanomma pulvis-pyrius CBS 109.77]